MKFNLRSNSLSFIMILKFISPNLKHVHGKIYYLNNNELDKKKEDYVYENYYVTVQSLYDIDNVIYKCKINSYSTDVLFEFDDSSLLNKGELQKTMNRINNEIVGIYDYDKYYSFSIE